MHTYIYIHMFICQSTPNCTHDQAKLLSRSVPPQQAL